MTNSTKGYILGAIAAISYGTNPLFAVPLYELGMGVPSVLFYRYAFATLILGAIMLIRKDSFRLKFQEIPMMMGLGVLFALSSALLFESYRYMDVGLASTLLFVEPLFIALMLWVFFRQRISLMTVISIALCLTGVAFLCNPGEGARVTATGVILVMLSSLSYAIYMVMINKSRLQRLPGPTITFYSLLFGIIVFVVQLDGGVELQAIPARPVAWLCIAGISIVPTIISLMTVAVSIHYVGSVAVSILGALEPITGLIFGVALFGEILTVRAAIGVMLIISAVMVLVLANPIKHIGSSAYHRITGSIRRRKDRC
ncbi:MAG: DMT family transporter [Duncaniella sp.]|nr:DMT family transporter [Duncaniella sp.]